ncbi:MAG: permease-like cell division protein FtsX [Erysipelotrichaceae bacterium]|nr:permease-like cell division protein FtsX [Erysipelotrichaceae bacterium]
MRFFRRFFRHIRDGFSGVFRHFSMAFSSMSAVSITLLLVGVFAAFAINVNFLTQEIQSNISLVCLIDYSADEATKTNIENEIKKIDGISTIEYRTKDQEFDYYKETYPELAEFSEYYREDNPFHDTFIVYMNDNASLENIKSSISKISGISSVEDGGSNTYTLISILRSTRIAGLALIGALVALAVYLIYNTIKITISARKDEITIMRTVGAKNSYIRAPFLVEGIIIGIIGSLLPIGIIIYLYYRLYEFTGGVLAGVITLVPVYPYAIYLGVGLLVIGIVVGWIGSFISVCRFLRLTR